MYRGRKSRILHGASTFNKLPNGYRVNLGSTEGMKNQSEGLMKQLFHFMHGDMRRGQGIREC